MYNQKLNKELEYLTKNFDLIDNNITRIDELIKLDTDPDIIDQALTNAILENDLDKVDFFSKRVLDINYNSTINNSFFTTCCEALKNFRFKNNDYTYQSDLKSSALQSAAILLKNGASPSKYEDNLSSPLWEAINSNFIDLVDLLIRNGAHFEFDFKETSPFLAVTSPEMLNHLLKYKLDVNQKNNNINGYNTPLHAFAYNNSIDLMIILLENGANIYEVNRYQHTAFHAAIIEANISSILQILELCDIQKIDKIYSIMKYLEEKDSPIPKLLFFAKQLNLDTTQIGKSPHLDLNRVEASKQNSSFQKLYSNYLNFYNILSKKNPQVLKELSQFEDFYYPSFIYDFIKAFKSASKEWELFLAKNNVTLPISSLELNYNGSKEEPFNCKAEFTGYSKNKEVLFEKTGAIQLDHFFKNTEQLLFEYDELFEDILSYQQSLAFCYLNLAFDQFTRSEDFKNLPIEKPFKLSGAESNRRELKTIYILD